MIFLASEKHTEQELRYFQANLRFTPPSNEKCYSWETVMYSHLLMVLEKVLEPNIIYIEIILRSSSPT